MPVQGMGKDQRKWIERIRSGGGEIEVEVTVTPTAWLEVPGGKKPIRIPIRMIESLFERDLFERVREGPGWTTYRLKDDELEG